MKYVNSKSLQRKCANYYALRYFRDQSFQKFLGAIYLLLLLYRSVFLRIDNYTTDRYHLMVKLQK